MNSVTLTIQEVVQEIYINKHLRPLPCLREEGAEQPAAVLLGLGQTEGGERGETGADQDRLPQREQQKKEGPKHRSPHQVGLHGQ